MNRKRPPDAPGFRPLLWSPVHFIVPARVASARWGFRNVSLDEYTPQAFASTPAAWQWLFYWLKPFGDAQFRRWFAALSILKTGPLPTCHFARRVHAGGKCPTVTGRRFLRDLQALQLVRSYRSIGGHLRWACAERGDAIVNMGRAWEKHGQVHTGDRGPGRGIERELVGAGRGRNGADARRQPGDHR